MKPQIYCKTISKGKQAFYIKVESKDYLLFIRNYRVSNRDFFAKGLPVNVALKAKNHHSTSIRLIAEELIDAIHYIEMEYGFAILEKSVNKKKNYNRVKKYCSYYYDEYEEIA
jgi:hypothetical protein